jgi:hypothetical protein
MMCLGWSAEPTCNAADQVQIGCPTAVPLTAGAGVAAANAVSGVCPDITWFWLSGAAILIGGMLKRKKRG